MEEDDGHRYTLRHIELDVARSLNPRQETRLAEALAVSGGQRYASARTCEGVVKPRVVEGGR
jgi:hypothetical protein